jgi:hypothetical protein
VENGNVEKVVNCFFVAVNLRTIDGIEEFKELKGLDEDF